MIEAFVTEADNAKYYIEMIDWNHFLTSLFALFDNYHQKEQKILASFVIEQGVWPRIRYQLKIQNNNELLHEIEISQTRISSLCGSIRQILETSSILNTVSITDQPPQRSFYNMQRLCTHIRKKFAHEFKTISKLSVSFAQVYEALYTALATLERISYACGQKGLHSKELGQKLDERSVALSNLNEIMKSFKLSQDDLMDLLNKIYNLLNEYNKERNYWAISLVKYIGEFINSHQLRLLPVDVIDYIRYAVNMSKQPKHEQLPSVTSGTAKKSRKGKSVSKSLGRSSITKELIKVSC